MPTKKKRVGFIPREDVMKIINNLSMENNLSNSKIISILVEEALCLRGIFNKNTGKSTQSYNSDKNDFQELSENSIDLNNNDKVETNTKLKKHKNSEKKYLLKQLNQVDFDLQTFKKFLSFLKFQELIDEFDS